MAAICYISTSGLSVSFFFHILASTSYYVFLNMTILVNRASLVAQMVKNLPAIQETRVQSLDQEDPVEREMATYSNILAWRILWTEEPGGLKCTGWQRVRHDGVIDAFTIIIV